MSHKYNMNDSLWYCGGPDRPVLNVFINGYMHEDTPGGIPRYLVHCDTELLAEEVPILESDLYRTELEAQSAKMHMLIRKGDSLLKQQIANDKAKERQAAIVSQLVARGGRDTDTIHGDVELLGSYSVLKVGCKGKLSLERGASANKVSIESGGTCTVKQGACISNAEIHEGMLVVNGGRVSSGYIDDVNGQIEVNRGGYAKYITLSAGIMTVSRANASNIAVTGFGNLVLADSEAFASVVNVNGANACVTVCSGTLCSCTVVRGSARIATNTTVKDLCVLAGGIVEHHIR